MYFRIFKKTEWSKRFIKFYKKQCEVACLFYLLFVVQKIVKSRLLNPFRSFDWKPSFGKTKFVFMLVIYIYIIANLVHLLISIYIYSI